jgi:hypothetical protein
MAIDQHVPHGPLGLALLEPLVQELLRALGLLLLFAEPLPQHAVGHVGRGQLHRVDLQPHERSQRARTHFALQLGDHVSHGGCLARARHSTHICARQICCGLRAALTQAAAELVLEVVAHNVVDLLALGLAARQVRGSHVRREGLARLVVAICDRGRRRVQVVLLVAE